MVSAPNNKRFFLFGYPVAHSASPSFQNCCFDHMDTGNQFSTWSTSKVTDEMMEMLTSDECGGSAVTMPIKAAIIPFLDEVSPESKITDACNTIVKVSTGPSGIPKLVGQNTDILGVRNSLINGLRSQFLSHSISPSTCYPKGSGAGLIVGGGATTRSAAYALTLLGLSPIFLVNRDPAEVQFVRDSMAHLTFIHLRNPDDVEIHLGQGLKQKPTLLMAVGAIPAIAPATHAERMVYTTVMSVLTIPYIAPTMLSDLPFPTKRIFLEMPYKPRRTPMLQIAEAMGWHGINGIQAMIEQGLAQQRMWYTGKATVEVGSDSTILPPEVEVAARRLAEEMDDIMVEKEEDRATGRETKGDNNTRSSI